MTSGRSDPCPCGSGARYQRCCLDRELELERLVPELEAAVQDLGDEILCLEREWSLERFAELYGGGIDSFGLLGPSDAELLDARLWFLLDCPLPEGQTPLWRRRQAVDGRAVDGRAVELLARSELRAWRIESGSAPGSMTGLCTLGGGRARLQAVRPPVGELRPGALIVARSVPLGPERWALLGRVPVVDPAAAADFELLLASLDAPRGEFWSVHGGVLSHAAWTWPEAHECTARGQIVEDSHVSWPVLDVVGVVAALHADPEFDPADVLGIDGTSTWRWRWDPPRPRPALGQPGVQVAVCAEDAAAEPYLATVTVNPQHRDLWCFAPTPARLQLARGLLEPRVPGQLGPAGPVRTEPPEVMPRWKRLRLADVLPAESALRLPPRRAA